MKIEIFLSNIKENIYTILNSANIISLLKNYESETHDSFLNKMIEYNNDIRNRHDYYQSLIPESDTTSYNQSINFNENIIFAFQNNKNIELIVNN